MSNSIVMDKIKQIIFMMINLHCLKPYENVDFSMWNTPRIHLQDIHLQDIGRVPKETV